MHCAMSPVYVIMQDGKWAMDRSGVTACATVCPNLPLPDGAKLPFTTPDVPHDWQALGCFSG